MKSFAKSLLGLVVGIGICLLLTAAAGENPIAIFQILIKSAFGSRYNLGLTLFYSTSLVFTGLSVCIAFHAGLFNIGAEGQLTVATLAAAATGLLWPQIPAPFSFILATSAAVLAGSLWGFIPGWLRAMRGSHEVVVTMMMNFIASGVTSFFALNVFRTTQSQNPETALVPSTYMFKPFDFVASAFDESPVNISVLIAIVVAVATHWALRRTSWGYELFMTGKNETAAELSGISSQRVKIGALTAAGAFASLVALNEVMGSSGKFAIGFSADYGFVGIAVALLARNNPLGVLLSAFLFGALQKGAADLDLETNYITRDFTRILQAVIIFSVVGFHFVRFQSIRQFFRKKRIVRNET